MLAVGILPLSSTDAHCNIYSSTLRVALAILLYRAIMLPVPTHSWAMSVGSHRILCSILWLILPTSIFSLQFLLLPPPLPLSRYGALRLPPHVAYHRPRVARWRDGHAATNFLFSLSAITYSWRGCEGGHQDACLYCC